MKVIVEENIEPKFPSLWKGKKSNCIVLFYSSGSGVVLDSADATELMDGQDVCNFSMEHFTLLNGSVILSND